MPLPQAHVGTVHLAGLRLSFPPDWGSKLPCLRVWVRVTNKASAIPEATRGHIVVTFHTNKTTVTSSSVGLVELGQCALHSCDYPLPFSALMVFFKLHEVLLPAEPLPSAGADAHRCSAGSWSLRPTTRPPGQSPVLCLLTPALHPQTGLPMYRPDQGAPGLSQGAARSRALAAVYISSSSSHPGRPLLVVQARRPCSGLRPLCLECSSFFLYPQHCFLTNSYSSPSSRSDVSSMETSPFIPGRKHSFHLKLLIHIWYRYTIETSF